MSTTKTKKQTTKATAKTRKPTSKAKAKTEPNYTVLPMDKLHVEPGWNPRQTFDPEALQTLAESIEETGGVAQNIGALSDGDGGWFVVTGERRYRAAAIAKVGTIGARIYETREEARLASHAENEHREDLNVIERARSLQFLKEDCNIAKVATLAKKGGVSTNTAGLYLRLLKLPEGVQAYFADERLSTKAEPVMRMLAEESAALAEAVAEVAIQSRVTAEQMERELPSLLWMVEDRKRELPSTPFLCDPDILSLGDVTEAVADLPALESRIADLLGASPEEREKGEADVEAAQFRLEEAEVDAARAAGCLFEIIRKDGSRKYVVARYLTDKVFAAELLGRVVDRTRAEAAEEAIAAAAARAGENSSSGSKETLSLGKKAYAKRKKAKEAAVTNNEKLGLALLKRRSGATRRKYTLSRAKAIVIQDLDRNPGLCAAGVRLALPQFRSVETTELKSGKKKSVTTYATATEAEAAMRARVEDARNVPEVLEIWADLRIAAALADEAAVTQKEQVSHRDWPGAMPKLLDEDAATVAAVVEGKE
jgi:ParB/RepB/Spo0J family partition protein